ncbi:MAG: TetR/AcrR family transcriptional regulator [Acidimicrobiales bacterium]
MARRAGGRPSRLTHEEIVREAWALLDADGLDGFSMRRLAARLEVAAMTIYRYFPSQDALFDAVVDHGAHQFDLSTGDGPWRQQLTDLFRLLRRALARHPFLVELRLRRPMVSQGALRFTEAGYHVMRQAGFTSAEIPWAFRNLLTFTFGHAGFGPHDTEEERRDTLASLVVLSPQDYPALTDASAAIVASLDGDALFERGLELLLDALEDRLGSRTRPPDPPTL